MLFKIIEEYLNTKLKDKNFLCVYIDQCSSVYAQDYIFICKGQKNYRIVFEQPKYLIRYDHLQVDLADPNLFKILDDICNSLIKQDQITNDN